MEDSVWKKYIQTYDCWWRNDNDFFHDMMSIGEIVISVVFEYFPIEIAESYKGNNCGSEKSEPSTVVCDVISRPSVFGESKNTKKNAAFEEMYSLKQQLTPMNEIHLCHNVPRLRKILGFQCKLSVQEYPASSIGICDVIDCFDDRYPSTFRLQWPRIGRLNLSWTFQPWDISSEEKVGCKRHCHNCNQNPLYYPDTLGTFKYSPKWMFCH